MVYLTKLLESTTKFYLYLCLEISEWKNKSNG